MRSDSDDSDRESEPNRKAAAPQEDTEMKGENEGDDGEESEEGEEEYVVERIEAHEWDAREKCYKYKTKWMNWDAEEDRTWEPREHLDGALECLEEYFESIGGEPAPPQKGGPKKRGRPSGPEQDLKKPRLSPASGGRQKRVEEDVPGAWGPADGDKWDPPKVTKDAWEELLIAVETIEPDSQGDYWAYLRWSVMDKQGKHRHTKHPLSAVYKAAPQMMLKFYEKHLVFSDKKS